MSYRDEVWQFVVREVGPAFGPGSHTHGQVVFQSDDEAAAVRFCLDHREPAFVLRWSGDRVFQNF